MIFSSYLQRSSVAKYRKQKVGLSLQERDEDLSRTETSYHLEPLSLTPVGRYVGMNSIPFLGYQCNKTCGFSAPWWKLTLRVSAGIFALLPIGIANAQAAVAAPEAHSKPTIAKRGPSDPIERAKALVEQIILDEQIAQFHGIRTEEHFRCVPGVPRLHIPSLGTANGLVDADKGQQLPQLQATALRVSISMNMHSVEDPFFRSLYRKRITIYPHQKQEQVPNYFPIYLPIRPSIDYVERQ